MIQDNAESTAADKNLMFGQSIKYYTELFPNPT